jgi:hypothetical protein
VKSLLNKWRGEKAEASVIQPITIVSGLPRSGTSMMMKMLAAGGIVPLTDELRAADKDNPKGYYEFERVKQLDKGDTEWLPLARGKAVKIISFLLQYLPPGETYKVVFLRRNLDEILLSQRKMLVNRGEDPNKMDDDQVAAMFTRHIELVENWLARQPNIDTLYIHYNDVMSVPAIEIARITRFLDRPLEEEAMAQVVDPNLYRNRQLATAG